MFSIGAVGERIRDFVNTHDVFERYFQPQADAWNRLTVAMDTLGDTCEALLDFEQLGFSGPLGTRYLRFYGTLQAIVLQQDSIAELHCLFIGQHPTVPVESAWVRIRRLRNLASGHPLNKRGDATIGALRTFVQRSDLSPTDIRLMLCEERTGTVRFEKFDLTLTYQAYKTEALVLLSSVAQAQQERWL